MINRRLFSNAKTLPEVFYGLHMAEGLAEYSTPNEAAPLRVLILENALKQMDSTFPGKPVFVRHKPDYKLEDLEREADGYVIESFFNQLDGKHWCKFVAVTDAAKEAIKKGWKLSNCYQPKTFSNGGRWHNVEYQKEITDGEYHHLALVPDPRYEESIILTPEDFKAYNSQKERELVKLANSKETEIMFNLFKREKLENSAAQQLADTYVKLPKTGKEKSISQLINEADEHEAKKDAPQMANGEHEVEVAGEKMKVNELVEKHVALKNEMAELKKNSEKPAASEKDEDPSKKKENESAADEKAEDPSKKKENDAADGDPEKDKDKKQNATSTDSNKGKNFDLLANAAARAASEDSEPTVDLTEDKVQRGKSRYGSNE